MRRGTSIIEVLFAMAIVAIGLLGSISVLAIAGRNSSAGLTADAAARVAANADQEFRVREMDSPRRTWLTLAVPGVSYCLDPRGVARNGSDVPDCYFPAVDPAIVPGPRMIRQTLRQEAGGPLFPLVVASADAIFQDRNDLVHELPQDRSASPVAVFEAGELRSFTGRLSWMATLHRPNKSPMISDELQLASDQSILCIVVFENRNAADLSSERILTVTEIEGSTVTIAPRSGRPQSDMAVSEGEWMMLLGVDADGRERFAWQRVIHAPAMAPTDADRTMTIAGSDWSLPSSQTHAVLLDGVVLVAERSIRIR